MNDNSNVASIERNAFHCPVCGAFAQQIWLRGGGKQIGEHSLPIIDHMTDDELLEVFCLNAEGKVDDVECKKSNLLNRKILHVNKNYTKSAFHVISGLNASSCRSCLGVSLWVYGRLIHPQENTAPLPNTDLPSEILRDYEEASSIINKSPRGAAELIRLCIQKLCIEIGESGKNINNDIASLVKKGLDVRVQKALDAIRVTGNNAVHPGTIDLQDDRATAEMLFRLLNLIAEKMISEPKHVDEVYNSLPSSALAAIEKRDKIP